MPVVKGAKVDSIWQLSTLVPLLPVQEAGKVNSGKILFSDGVPVLERLSCSVHGCRGIAPLETCGQIVVGFVAGLLQVDKGLCNSLNRSGNRIHALDRIESPWPVSRGEGLRDIIHIAVGKHAADTAREFILPREKLRCF